MVAIGHEALDTDTTEKMESETWLLRHGHYQIEVDGQSRQGAAEGRADRGDLAEGENGLGFPARAFAILP